MTPEWGVKENRGELVPSVLRGFRAFFRDARYHEREVSYGQLRSISFGQERTPWVVGGEWLTAECFAESRRISADPACVCFVPVIWEGCNEYSCRCDDDDLWERNHVNGRPRMKNIIQNPAWTQHTSPDVGCSCGFYATFDLHNLFKFLGPHLMSYTIGVVEASGMTVLGTKGFRSERMRVVEILELGGFSPTEFRAEELKAFIEKYPPDDVSELIGEKSG